MRYQKRRCSPPPSPHRQVVVGPKSGVHGLICLDREGTACTKAVQQSRVLIEASQLFFLGRLWGQAFLRAVLRLRAFRRLLGCLPVRVRVALGSCCLLVGWVGPVSSPPGEGVVFLLCVFPFLVLAFVVLVLFACWGVCRSGPSCSGSPWTSPIFSLFLGLAAALSWPSACPSFPGFVFEELVYSIVADFDVVTYFGRFAAFSELRGTRQVERFAACSVTHLPHVVFHPGG